MELTKAIRTKPLDELTELQQKVVLLLLKRRVKKILTRGQPINSPVTWAKSTSWAFEFDSEYEMKLVNGVFEVKALFNMIVFEDWGVGSVKQQELTFGRFSWEDRDRFCEYLYAWIKAIEWLEEEGLKNPMYHMPSDFYFPDVWKLKTPWFEDEFYGFLIKPNRMGRLAKEGE